MQHTYPISEIFHSLQGEGIYTGTPMMFIRLAGCNVGEYGTIADTGRSGGLPILGNSANDVRLLQQRKHSVCTAISGERFLCDTDYHSFEKKTVEQLIDEHSTTREGHICITGGEPFMHDLAPLIVAFQSRCAFGRPVMVHIETSGTKPFPDTDKPPFDAVALDLLWITCSPKKGLLKEFLPHVDEFKILVGEGISDNWLERFVAALTSYPKVSRVNPGRIFIQPINGVHDELESSREKCLELLRKYPYLRMSPQLHKYLHQR